MRALTSFLIALAVQPGSASAPMQLVQRIPLPRVEGRIDHLAFDPATAHLFVAALGNNTVEVIDVAQSRHVASLPGFQEPQGIGIAPDAGLVAVANGEGQGIRLLKRDGFTTASDVALGDDSDNVRYDEREHRLYVGYGSGTLAAVDPSSARVIGRVPLAGHPESFQLEHAGPRIFINIPNAHQIAVVDRQAMKLSATWPIAQASANFPMALDETTGRIVVGCRHPAVALVLDAAGGRQLDSVPIVGDTDDLFFDARRQRLYVTGGEGFLDVLEQSGGRFTRTAHLQTAAGARTSLFVPGRDRLFVAVPHRGSHAAEIQVFAPAP